MLLTVKDSDNEELRVDFLRNIKNSISASATRFLGYEQHVRNFQLLCSGFGFMVRFVTFRMRTSFWRKYWIS